MGSLVPALSSEDLLDKALAEYYEGDSFGWEAANVAARYVAHQALWLWQRLASETPVTCEI